MKKQDKYLKNRDFNKLDERTNSAVNWFNDLKNLSFDQSSVWRSIESRLENMDKKILSWFFAMATSFTFLVAAGLEYASDYRHFVPSEKENIVFSELLRTTESKHLSTRQEHSIESIETVKKKTNRHFIEETRLEKININQYVNKQRTENYPSKRILGKLSVNGEIGYSQQLTPGVGLEINILAFKSGSKTHSFNVGYTAQLMFSSSTSQEFQTSNNQIFSFVKLGYSITNNREKGWALDSSYLLNPDDNFYKNQTVKISAHRKINKHIRLGPDLIFTDDFKSILPSISIIFSS